MGWSLTLPNIARMTSRGLPRYTADDLVAASGEELVAVERRVDRAVYRARYEGGFVRYTWFHPESGGYWLAEFPDGKRSWFGATAEGVAVPAARVEGPEGVAEWRLTEQRDAVSPLNRVRYEWELNASGWAYVRAAEWAEGVSGFRYRVTFTYESRVDVISEARYGFDLRQDRRVRQIEVSRSGRRVKSWRLSYEEEGGLSRLVRVERFGSVGQQPFPLVFEFGYTRSFLGARDSGGGG